MGSAVRASGALKLVKTSDKTTGETLISLPEGDYADFMFQWVIDGEAITESPIALASQLVIYPGKVSADRECSVLMFRNGSQTDTGTIPLGEPIATAPNSSLPPSSAMPATASGGSAPTLETAGDLLFVGSPVEVPLPTLLSERGRLTNLSVRAALRDDEPLIVGIVVSGAESKPVLVQAVGPTLAHFGINHALPDPELALYSSSTAIATNSDWDRPQDLIAAAAARQLGSIPLPNGSKDARIHSLLPPGNYTARVGSQDGASGIALAEFYDAGESKSSSRLANLSSLGTTGNGDDAMIVGFTIGGEKPMKVLIRAVGPSLSLFGVPHAAEDPVLFLYSHNTIIASNDDWTSSAYKREVDLSTVAAGAFALPPNSHDAALLLIMAPGSYSVVASNKENDIAGRVLVELYEVP